MSPEEWKRWRVAMLLVVIAGVVAAVAPRIDWRSRSAPKWPQPEEPAPSPRYPVSPASWEWNSPAPRRPSCPEPTRTIRPADLLHEWELEDVRREIREIRRHQERERQQHWIRTSW